jgi:protein-glutamine gamma-glutamyltransferase
MARTAALYAPPAALLAWSWLRLGQPHASSWTALWLVALALVPCLLPRARWRVPALLAVSVLALHASFGVWGTHPLRLFERFGRGFLEFYDVRLPFASIAHPRMEGVVLIALFASCLLVGLAIAARRPILAAVTLVVAAGWPATLLTGPDDLGRGVVLLAVVLSLIFGVGGSIAPRRLAFAALAGSAVVLAAFAASTSNAVASGQVLRWQKWDFYNRPPKPVGVSYVWNSDFRGLHFPKKVTPVLSVAAPARPTYWRATTLDQFEGGNWYENNPALVAAFPINGRDELTLDEEFPRGAGNPARWIRQDVTVRALHDNHLIGASVPVAYVSGTHAVNYASGGVAYLQDRPLSPGDRYSVWSYEAKPKPRQLASLPADYPESVRSTDLYVEARARSPVWGASNREQKLATLFENSYRARQYEAFYRLARRIVGEPTNPYAAALELEGWFRSGAFVYDETPPAIGNVPPLAAFALRTHRGYCQHFAGAMALMLRYLGIPARVAAGFTSGRYDDKTHEWTVTDHDAHTWVEVWFPRYGWLPFDPTPGRALDGSYTTSSPHFDLSDGLLAAAQKLQRAGTFNLRKLRDSRQGKPAAAAKVKKPARPADSGGGIGALLELLVLLALALGALVVLAKLVIRKRRYLTRDPRRIATACVRELADYANDQGAKAPPNASLGELARVVEQELGPSAAQFAAAAAEARYGPSDRAREAARATRRELKTLRRELRAGLSRFERVLGLVSLRSLGLTG